MHKTIIVVLIAIALNLIYRRFKYSEELFDTTEQYKIVNEYLLGERLSDLKPILWVHSATEVNARNWESFQSRTSTNLNQPYVLQCIQSIYDKCGESFNVCLIDDTVFAKLIPKWALQVENMASPAKEHYRQLGFTSLLYFYGGMLVPASTLCVRNLLRLHTSALDESDFYAVEKYGDGVFVPNPEFMGCRKRSAAVGALLTWQHHLCETDKTSASDFNGEVSNYLKQKAVLVDGTVVGLKRDGQPLSVEDWLGSTALDLQVDAVCLPGKEILRRPKFSWFCRMSTAQISKSNLAISPYMRASLTP
jgi:hypothetical protein